MSDIYKVYGSLLDCIIRLSGHKLYQLTLDWEADIAFPQSDYVVSPMVSNIYIYVYFFKFLINLNLYF